MMAIKDCICVDCGSKWYTTYSWVRYCPFCNSDNMKARNASPERLRNMNFVRLSHSEGLPVIGFTEE
jgi:Zn finger protein HypA/HybF involved in hydrogenase expression